MDYLIDGDKDTHYSTVLKELPSTKIPKNEAAQLFTEAAFPPHACPWTLKIAYGLTTGPELSEAARGEAVHFLRRAIHQWTTSSSYVQWHQAHTVSLVGMVEGLMQDLS